MHGSPFKAGFAAMFSLGTVWTTLQWAGEPPPEPPVLGLESVAAVHGTAPSRWTPVIPYVPPPPRPEVVLERRLAAIAAAAREPLIRDSQPTSFDAGALAEDLETILADVPEAAQISIHIRDVDSNRVLFDYFGDSPLNPASNQKLLTSSAALDLLGPDYTFATHVRRGATTLYLQGEGDPVLHLDEIEDLAQAVADRIDPASFRELVVDDSVFSQARLGPGYDSEGPGWAYEAESSALSINYNMVEIHVSPTRHGVRVTTYPESAAIDLENHATVGRGQPLAARTFQDGDTTKVVLTGTISRSSRPVVLRRRIHRPSVLCGALFAEALARVTATQPLTVRRGQVPRDAELLARHESPSLLEVLDLGLAYSNNFIAEQVLRTLAWRMTGKPGDWHAGQDILRGYWSALVGNAEDVVIENGAGLSRSGRLTAEGLADLIAMASRATPGERLIDALPVAGDPGTLRSRLRSSGRRVRAKTGTLDGVSGLSGVITRESGEPLVAFSVLINADEVDGMHTWRRNRIEDRVVLTTLTALDEYEARRMATEPGPDPLAAAGGPT